MDEAVYDGVDAREVSEKCRGLGKGYYKYIRSAAFTVGGGVARPDKLAVSDPCQTVSRLTLRHDMTWEYITIIGCH